MKTVPLGELIQPAAVRRAGKDADYPVLSMTMRDGLMDQTAKFKKRVASADLSDYKVVQHGQLVVGFPIDEGVLDFQGLYSAAVVSPAYGVWDLRRAERIYVPYFTAFLRSPQALAYYRAKLQGSTARRRSLPAGVFLELPVPVPSYEGQKRIAAILDQADAMRAKRRHVLALLDSLTRSIFHVRFASAPGGRPLREFIDANDKINYGVVQPGPDVPNGVPLIRVSDLKDGRVSRDTLKRISPEIESAYSRSRLKGNEVLISCVGSIGEVAESTSVDADSNIARAVARIPISDASRRNFVAHFLRSKPAQRRIQEQVRVVAQPTLNIKQINELEIPIPSASDLEAFAHEVRSIEAMRVHTQNALTDANELFASLQARAFRGEL